MLTNYLKIAFRNLTRNKSYALINILGLALGVACCLLLSLYVVDELSYDQQHDRLNDLYRVVSTFEAERGLDRLGSSSPAIAPGLKAELPEIETAVRVVNPPNALRQLIRYQDNLFFETNGLIADSTLFQVFKYDLLEGNPKKALVEANSVVLSERLAHKLFGDQPALDKLISITQAGKPQEYKVTGVFAERYKSHIKANFFISMTSSGGIAEYLRTDAANLWGGNNFVPSYLKLVSGHNKAAVEAKMNAVLQKHGAKELKELGLRKTLALEPVGDIYLRSDVGQRPRIIYLYTISAIAVFILLIACINFMNLSTAKASKRATEIGIRKTMGAFRSSLMGQILGEAMVIVLLAMVVSLVLVQLTLPFFNEVTGKAISFTRETAPYLIAAILLLTLITGVLAGSYPAFYLSSFQPAQVLKGKLRLGNSSSVFRQTLVIVQFVIAISLMCSIFIVSDQLRFMTSTSPGFEANSKIIVPLRSSEAHQQYQTLKKEIQQLSSVQHVSAVDYAPGVSVLSDMMFYQEGSNMDKAILNKRISVDYGYLEQMEIKLLAGRSFNTNRESESKGNVILNKTSASKFGFTPQQAIGQALHFELQGKKYDFQVIGVTDDYHQTSLHEKIEPILFEMASNDNFYDYIVVSLSNPQVEQSAAAIEKIWKSLVHETPFEYSFLDQDIQQQYEQDRKLARMITSFGVIALVICCMGLFGLSSYLAERRFKEIGIRKVMGASVAQIVRMMSSEFVRLVIIAFAIAVPISWYAMQQWLQGFAYRVEVHALVFVLAGVIALVVALLTVSFESIKSALRNPVDSLRNE